MPDSFTQSLPRSGGFLVSEANYTRSREQIVVASGAGVLAPGTVLGKITASGKYVLADTGLANGAEVAAAILFDEVDATSADATGVAIVRDAEVNDSELTYNSGDEAAHKAELPAVGIIPRDAA